jgi:hypothetical protein
LRTSRKPWQPSSPLAFIQLALRRLPRSKSISAVVARRSRCRRRTAVMGSVKGRSPAPTATGKMRRFRTFPSSLRNGEVRPEQRFCLFEIGHREAFGEPAVDRREKVAGFDVTSLVATQTGEAHDAAQFPELGPPAVRLRLCGFLELLEPDRQPVAIRAIFTPSRPINQCSGNRFGGEFEKADRRREFGNRGRR